MCRIRIGFYVTEKNAYFIYLFIFYNNTMFLISTNLSSHYSEMHYNDFQVCHRILCSKTRALIKSAINKYSI